MTKVSSSNIARKKRYRKHVVGKRSELCSCISNHSTVQLSKQAEGNAHSTLLEESLQGVDDGDEHYGHWSDGEDSFGPDTSTHTSQEWQKIAKTLSDSWLKIREQLADAYNGLETTSCRGNGCGCTQSSYTVSAIGTPDSLRVCRKITFTHRSCEEISSVMLSHGYFPSTPMRPNFVICVDWLEFYDILGCSTGVSCSAFVDTLSQFIEFHDGVDVPPAKHIFPMIHDQWQSMKELAEKNAFDTLPGGAYKNAVAGTLAHQCLACFYRIEPEADCQILQQTSADESSASGQSSRACGRLAQDDVRQETLRSKFFLSVDANFQHKRLVQQSREQKITEWRDLFSNTRAFRPPFKTKRGKTFEWQDIKIDPPKWLSEPAPLHLPIKDTGLGISPPHLVLRNDSSYDTAEEYRSIDFPLARRLVHKQTRVFSENPDAALSGCPHKFIAHSTKSDSITRHEKPKTMVAYDETGLVGVVCRHGLPVRLGDLWRGENQITTLQLLHETIDQLPSNAPVFVQYDIACKFAPFVQHVRPDLASRVEFALNVFHSYAHNLDCQLIYDPRLRANSGCSDGEGVERFWSSLRFLVPSGRISGSQHRQNMLHEQMLRIAVSARREQPTTLAQRFRRISTQLDLALDQLRSSYTVWRETCNSEQPADFKDYRDFIHAKFEDNRAGILHPHRLGSASYETAFCILPYSAFFAQLCRVQKNERLLRPDEGRYLEIGLEFWKNISETTPLSQESKSILAALLQEANSQTTENFQLEDFHRGTRLWHQYFSEVCFVHLYRLRQHILAEVSARQTEYLRVHMRFQGTKEASEFHKKTLRRVKTIEEGIARHNLMIDWMMFISPVQWESSPLLSFKFDQKSFTTERFDIGESEELWKYFEHLRSFYEKDFKLTLLKGEIQQMFTLHRYERCVEELDLIRIEAERYSAFFISHFAVLVDSTSILRRRRGWQSYLRNCLIGIRNFIEHAKTFDLQDRGSILAVLWDRHAPHVLPLRETFGLTWRVSSHRDKASSGMGCELLSPVVTQWRRNLEGGLVDRFGEAVEDDDLSELHDHMHATVDVLAADDEAEDQIESSVVAEKWASFQRSEEQRLEFIDDLAALEIADDL